MAYQITCQCGRMVSVPTLSQLRKQSGQDPYARSSPEIIEGMIVNGEGPHGDLCTICGGQTLDEVLLHIQYESKWVRGTEEDKIPRVLLFWLLFGWIGALIGFSKISRKHEVLGRDSIVEAPLRVHKGCQYALTLASQSQLKKLLCKVPIYAKLIEEYPSSVITVIQQRKG